MIPLYVTHRKFLPRGARLPHLKRFGTYEDPCKRCGGDLKKKGTSQKFVTGFGWVHKSCEAMVKIPRDNVIVLPSTGERVVPRFPLVRFPDAHAEGNLEHDEYRFWIGVKGYLSTFAKCRACGRLLYSEVARKAHKQETTKVGVVYMNCNERLVAAYRRLLIQGKCVVCKGETFKKTKFGVPLCSLKCIEEWKFSQERHLLLESALHQSGF